LMWLLGRFYSCQAHEPSNPLQSNNIRMTHELYSTLYTENRDQKQRAADTWI